MTSSFFKIYECKKTTLDIGSVPFWNVSSRLSFLGEGAYLLAMLTVCLYQPEIPPNTGNIIRLCANTGSQPITALSVRSALSRAPDRARCEPPMASTSRSGQSWRHSFTSLAPCRSPEGSPAQTINLGKADPPSNTGRFHQATHNRMTQLIFGHQLRMPLHSNTTSHCIGTGFDDTIR